MMTTTAIFMKKNTTNCYGEVSGNTNTPYSVSLWGLCDQLLATPYGDSCMPQLPVDVLRYADTCVCDSHEPTKFWPIGSSIASHEALL